MFEEPIFTRYWFDLARGKEAKALTNKGAGGEVRGVITTIGDNFLISVLAPMSGDFHLFCSLCPGAQNSS